MIILWLVCGIWMLSTSAMGVAVVIDVYKLHKEVKAVRANLNNNKFIDGTCANDCCEGHTYGK